MANKTKNPNSNEIIAEELEVKEEANNNITDDFVENTFTPFGAGIPDGSSTTPDKDIIIVPRQSSGGLNDISHIDFKFDRVEASLVNIDASEVKTTIYNYGERFNSIAYDVPTLIVAGAWNGVQYVPSSSYGPAATGGSKSAVSLNTSTGTGNAIFLRPSTGSVDAALFNGVGIDNSSAGTPLTFKSYNPTAIVPGNPGSAVRTVTFNNDLTTTGSTPGTGLMTLSIEGTTNTTYGMVSSGTKQWNLSTGTSTFATGTMWYSGSSFNAGLTALALTANSVFTSNGTVPIWLTPSTSGHVLQWNGSALVFNTVSLTTSISGILPSTNGGTGVNTSAATNGQILVATTGSPATWNAVTPAVSGTGLTGTFNATTHSIAINSATANTNNTIVLRDGAGRFQATDPSAAQDVATKNYVDSTAQGLDVKASVRVATTAALPTVTYVHGTAPNTLTASAVGILTVDGVSTVLNDRILVKNQAEARQNGIYYVSTAGTAGVAFVLTRATDADNASSASEVTAGLYTFVAEGTTNADTGWLLTTNDTIVMNNATLATNTALAFTQFSGAGSITAGTGLNQSGTTIAANINLDNSVASNAIRLLGGSGSNNSASAGNAGTTVDFRVTTIGSGTAIMTLANATTGWTLAGGATNTGTLTLSANGNVTINETGTLSLGTNVFAVTGSAATSTLAHSASAWTLTAGTGTPRVLTVNTGNITLAGSGTTLTLANNFTVSGGQAATFSTSGAAGAVTLTVPTSGTLNLNTHSLIVTGSTSNITFTPQSTTATTHNLVSSATAQWQLSYSNASWTGAGALYYGQASFNSGLAALAMTTNAVLISSSSVPAWATGSNDNVMRISSSVPGFGSINLAASGAVGSSILPTANGGTNQSAWTANLIVFATSATQLAAASSATLRAYWDGTNGRLGILPSGDTPDSPFHVRNDSTVAASPSAQTLGFRVSSETVTTAVNTHGWSPVIGMYGSVWNTTATAQNNWMRWRQEVRGTSGAVGTMSTDLTFSSEITNNATTTPSALFSPRFDMSSIYNATAANYVNTFRIYGSAGSFSSGLRAGALSASNTFILPTAVSGVSANQAMVVSSVSGTIYTLGFANVITGTTAVQTITLDAAVDGTNATSNTLTIKSGSTGDFDAISYSYSSGTTTLTFNEASATVSGFITTGLQAFSGTKTFNNIVGFMATPGVITNGILLPNFTDGGILFITDVGGDILLDQQSTFAYNKTTGRLNIGDAVGTNNSAKVSILNATAADAVLRLKHASSPTGAFIRAAIGSGNNLFTVEATGAIFAGVSNATALTINNGDLATTDERFRVDLTNTIQGVILGRDTATAASHVAMPIAITGVSSGTIAARAVVVMGTTEASFVQATTGNDSIAVGVALTTASTTTGLNIRIARFGRVTVAKATGFTATAGDYLTIGTGGAIASAASSRPASGFVGRAVRDALTGDTTMEMLIDIQPDTTTGSVTGSGTSFRLPLFSSSTGLVNSMAYQNAATPATFNISANGSTNPFVSITNMQGATAADAVGRTIFKVTGAGTTSTSNPLNATLVITPVAAQEAASIPVFMVTDSAGTTMKMQVDGLGNIRSTTKSFDIPHPTKLNKRLVYGVLEGPEHSVYHRGTISAKGQVYVELPEYWYKLTGNGYTVQLTPRGNYGCYLVETNEFGFYVRRSGLLGKYRNFEFDYVVIGSRLDAPLEIEQ